MKICKADGCEKKQTAKGYCHVHYYRERRKGTFDETAKKCTVDGCNNIHHGHGYCVRHYKQMKRHGKIFDRTIYDSNEFIEYNFYFEVVMYDIKYNETARALIDKDDYDLISKYKWRLSDTGYAFTSKGNKNIRMHRIIMNTPKDLEVDHINHKTLDNRKNNLRNVTKSQNQRNRIKPKGHSSEYKGVYWSKINKKWIVCINDKHIGCFENEIEAANIYNEVAKKEYGEYAYLNKIDRE